MRAIDAGTLTLEPQLREHAEEMFAVLGDPRSTRTRTRRRPRSTGCALGTKLESRQSADGAEQWLNWVIRIKGNGLIGYVQATLRRDGSAAIAYEMSSAHWGRGLGRHATEAMISELIEHYRVTMLFAVAKRGNFRSLRMLERLGFRDLRLRSARRARAVPDETLMYRNVATVTQ